MHKYRFGELVREVKAKVDRNNNPYEYYIAGDHMDSEDLTIHRRGRFATDDVGPAFIREFKKGQVLYGSRRTYLKKVSVADFDGVTSNTTFVLETKDENIMPQALLPFIMLTDRFTSWSIGKSKGSTNPYILFSDLENYEIELPEIEKQRELARILWEMFRLKERYNDVLRKSDELIQSQFVEMFGDCKCKRLGDYIRQVRGVSYKPADLSVSLDNDHITLLRANNISNGELKFDDVQFVDKSKVSKSQLLQTGDIVMCASSGSIEHVGKSALYGGDGDYTFGAFCKVVRASGLLSPRYIYSFFMTDEYKSTISLLACGTNINNLRNEHIDELMIPVPTEAQQQEFSLFAEQLDKSKYNKQFAIKGMREAGDLCA